MKKLIFIALLIMILYSCCKEEKPYNPQFKFIANDKLWSICDVADDRDSTGRLIRFYASRHDYYKLGDDTIIDGEKWKILQSRIDKYNQNWDNLRFLKEINGKVYYKYRTENAKILYDFSLNKGDKFLFKVWENKNYYLIVDSVKYKPLLNNEVRKHIYLSKPGSYGYVVWIEGIGSTNGVLLNSGMIGMLGGEKTVLLCCHENEALVYQDTTLGINSCYFGDTIYVKK